MSRVTIFTDYIKDVEQHIESRICGIPKHELQDISAYIANRAQVMVGDMLYERDREWKRSLEKGSKYVISYERPEDNE